MWLFVGAFVLRLLGGLIYPVPAYPDSFYYVNVAQQLASGHGFSVDYIWNFVEVGGRLPAVATLPVPVERALDAARGGHPGAVHLAARRHPFAQSLPFWIAAATAAPLTYLIGRDMGLDDRLSLTAGLLAAFPGAAAPFLSQPDNFALFMPLGALALWLCARGTAGRRRAFIVGGAIVGLATLSRNDGVLLGVPFAFAFLVDLRRRRGPDRRIGWQAAIGCAVAFLVVVGPWFARQLAVFGSLSPSAANGRILFIREYRELYSITSDTSLAGFLGQGPVALLASRAGGLVSALLIFAAVPLLLYLVPFVAGAAWRLRRDRHFAPWHIYAIVAVRLQRPAVRRPRALRHVPPLGRRAGAARVPAGGDRHRRCRRLGRAATRRRGTPARRRGSSSAARWSSRPSPRSARRSSSARRGARTRRSGSTSRARCATSRPATA